MAFSINTYVLYAETSNKTMSQLWFGETVQWYMKSNKIPVTYTLLPRSDIFMQELDRVSYLYSEVIEWSKVGILNDRFISTFKTTVTNTNFRRMHRSISRVQLSVYIYLDYYAMNWDSDLHLFEISHFETKSDMTKLSIDKYVIVLNTGP